MSSNVEFMSLSKGNFLGVLASGPFDNSFVTSDFDPWGISKSYDIKFLCNFEIIKTQVVLSKRNIIYDL